MTTPAHVLPFDPRPLTEPVDARAARAFARELRASGRAPGVLGGSSVAAVVIVAVVFFFVFATIGTAVIGGFVAALTSASGPLPFAALLPLLVIVGIAVVAGVVIVSRLRGLAERWYRLDRFARANGMSFIPQLSTPRLPGMIFSRGSGRTASDLLRGERPRFVEFANYRYTTGSGKNKTTHRWGYVAVRLDVPLPHIVLDAIGNNGLFGASNLPATFDRDQRLSLEGDFDRYFSLYCPAGYERDALYLFTPDIMARFIDNAAALDVEIVDDWLFLYAKRDFSTLDPATWAWLFSVVGALLDKLAQWARWRDERLRADAASTASSAAPAMPAPAASPAAPTAWLRPPPGVAEPGRRWKKGVPWATVIVVAAFGLFWLLMQSGFFAGLLDAIFNR